MTGALVIGGNKATPGADVDRRRLRFRLRQVAARALPKEAVARCGHRDHQGHVSIRNGDHGAFYGGVVTCGSVWHCPVCAAKIAERRREQIAELVEAHEAAGGSVYMAALTVPHQRIQTARELKHLVASTWSKRVVNGAPWKRNKARAGLMGMVRALEVTHGENGWHPHLHVLFFFAPGVCDPEIQTFGAFLFDRWRAAVQRAGYGWCNPSLWHFERAHSSEKAGEYVTKWGVDRELVSGHMKRARGAGRTPWMLLDDAERGDKAALMLFREFGAAFKGGRQLTWSRGLREHYGLREPEPDKDAACDDPEERAPLIGVLPRQVFREVWRRGLAVDLLEAVERCPAWSTVVFFLRQHGIDGYEPPGNDAGERRPGAAGCAYRTAATGAYMGPSGFGDGNSRRCA